MLESIKQIIMEAGALIRHVHTTADDISSKEGRANYVTRYDVRVQDYLFSRLSALLPEAIMVGEENASNQKIGDGYAFIIDPIDGTSNFIAGFHYSCISVALALNGQIILGVVYNPFNQEMFWAKRGCGSWKKAAYSNEITRLHVVDRPICEGLVCAATAHSYPEITDRYFLLARKILEKGTDIRRFGSGALELCHIADRRSVLFFELRLAPWDYAAAWLILEEAGGVITTVDGDAPNLNCKHSLAAGTPTAHAEFLQIARDTR